MIYLIAKIYKKIFKTKEKVKIATGPSKHTLIICESNRELWSITILPFESKTLDILGSKTKEKTIVPSALIKPIV